MKLTFDSYSAMTLPGKFTAAGRRVLDAHPTEKPPAAERAELVRLYRELTGVTKAKAAVVVTDWLFRARGTLLTGSGAGMPSSGSKEAQKAKVRARRRRSMHACMLWSETAACSPLRAPSSP